MELFREDGCLTDEGLQALVEGRLDELGRLEAAEHLSYCTKCLDRYTAHLTGDKLVAPPRDLSRPLGRDRKSPRVNSRPVSSSFAVHSLNKKGRETTART